LDKKQFLVLWKLHIPAVLEAPLQKKNDNKPRGEYFGIAIFKKICKQSQRHGHFLFEKQKSAVDLFPGVQGALAKDLG
jgi:hypothetical protein